MASSKLWFSLIDRHEYSGDSPAFYNKNHFEWESLLEEKHQIINQELINYLRKSNSLTSYFNYKMVNEIGAWKTIPLMSWGIKFHKHLKHFPETYNLLSKIPGLVSISFNVIEPKSSISPHFGDTNAIVRCHYGIKIPGQLPEVGFRVKNQERSWKEGEILIFCDGYTHEAWNNSSDQRIILLFDVILPEFLSQKKKICGSVISAIFLQKIAIRFNIKEPSIIILKIVHFFTKNSAIILTPLYNIITKLR